ncbi:MAG: Omp28-related outer membrane protein [Bacteroidia bacterium]
MKTIIKQGFVLFILVIFLSSCEEDPLPIIEANHSALRDTTYMVTPPSSAQTKVVLLEDLTGVRCPNCPIAHKAVKDILSVYPNQVVAVGIHPGKAEFPQAYPFNGEPDLNTPFGRKIMDIVTKPAGLPYGMVDRVLKANLTSTWKGYVDQRLAIPPSVNVSIDTVVYDSSSRKLRYSLRIEATAEINESVFISTLIREDSIIQKQDSISTIIEKYNHMHVLRDMPQFKLALNPNGSPSITPGRVFVKDFEVSIPVEWNAKNCSLAVFVHKEIEVLQAAQKGFK